jgi:integrase
MGSVYRKKRKQPDGTIREESTWWIKFYEHGVVRRESADTEKEQEARRILRAREGAVATGQPILPRADRVKWEEAEADLLTHYTATGTRDVGEVAPRLAHVDEYFRGRRLASIGPADSTAYAKRRQEEGASNATINRELAVLGRALRLAYEHNKLARLPILRKLKEAAPRAGFFEAAQYESVRRHLRVDARLACDLAHTFGWRMQSEVLPLEWRHVDLKVGTVRLAVGSTKNDDGRVVYLTPALLAGFAEQRERVKGLEKRLGRIIPWVFPHPVGAKRQSVGLRHVAVLGERRKDFRRAWATACRKAGVPGMLKHDFRRTAVRNLERSGVPRSVAMKITGHRTEAVYRRYAIVSDADLQAATRRLGTILGTGEGGRVDGRPVSV